MIRGRFKRHQQLTRSWIRVHRGRSSPSAPSRRWPSSSVAAPANRSPLGGGSSQRSTSHLVLRRPYEHAVGAGRCHAAIVVFVAGAGLGQLVLTPGDLCPAADLYVAHSRVVDHLIDPRCGLPRSGGLRPACQSCGRWPVGCRRTDAGLRLTRCRHRRANICGPTVQTGAAHAPVRPRRAGMGGRSQPRSRPSHTPRGASAPW